MVDEKSATNQVGGEGVEAIPRNATMNIGLNFGSDRGRMCLVQSDA